MTARVLGRTRGRCTARFASGVHVANSADSEATGRPRSRSLCWSSASASALKFEGTFKPLRALKFEGTFKPLRDLQAPRWICGALHSRQASKVN
jgi:hypothetical protein